MVTVKRQRKRSLVNPRGRQVIVALSALLALSESKGAYIEKSHALDEGAFLEYGFNQLAASLMVNPS